MLSTFEEVFRSIAGLIFIYPVTAVFKRYLRKMQNQEELESIFEYNFPRFSKYMKRLNNRKNNKRKE